MELAGNSSAGLIEAIASDNDLYLELIGVEFEENDDEHNLLDAKTSFTELNPGIAESFFEVFHTYIEDFGGEVDSGTHEYNESEQHLNLDPESRARFMQYIAGDEESAIRMIASVEDQQMENLSFEGLEQERPEVAGAENGTLQGLLDTNTASLGCLAWSWLEAMDDDGVQESWRCWFGVLSGLETVVGPTAFAGRAPARSGPHPGPGELSDRARPHPCQVLRGKKPRRSTTPSGERNWWRP